MRDQNADLMALQHELSETRAQLAQVQREAEVLKAECASISAEFGLPPTIRPAEGEISRMRKHWKQRALDAEAKVEKMEKDNTWLRSEIDKHEEPLHAELKKELLARIAAEAKVEELAKELEGARYGLGRDLHQAVERMVAAEARETRLLDLLALVRSMVESSEERPAKVLAAVGREIRAALTPAPVEAPGVKCSVCGWLDGHAPWCSAGPEIGTPPTPPPAAPQTIPAELGRFEQSGRCLRHGAEVCPSCLTYALGDAQRRVAALEAWLYELQPPQPRPIPKRLEGEDDYQYERRAQPYRQARVDYEAWMKRWAETCGGSR